MKIRLKAPKPLLYDPEPKTIGGHLKKRRHELKLQQKQVAGRLKINQCTYIKWEANRVDPEIRYWPRIIEFLGYDPLRPTTQSLGDQLAATRRALGLSRKRVATILRIDEATVANIENGTSRLTGEALGRVRQFVELVAGSNSLFHGNLQGIFRAY